MGKPCTHYGNYFDLFFLLYILYSIQLIFFIFTSYNFHQLLFNRNQIIIECTIYISKLRREQKRRETQFIELTTLYSYGVYFTAFHKYNREQQFHSPIRRVFRKLDVKQAQIKWKF